MSKHPDKIWNAIESSVCRAVSPVVPPAVLRWLYVLVHLGIVAFFGFCTLYVMAMGSACLDSIRLAISKEKIHQVPADKIAPEYEGRLVAVAGPLTVVEPVRDPFTGVSAMVPIMKPACSEHQTPEPNAKESVKFTSRYLYSPDFRVGAFRMANISAQEDWFRSESFLVYGPDKELIPAKSLHFSAPADGYIVAPSSGDSGQFLLSTAEGAAIGTFHYRAPKIDPESRMVYAVGRQLGDRLDLSDPNAGFRIDRMPYSLSNSTVKPSEITRALILMLASFGLLCIVLGSLRSGLWHATGGKNPLRFPVLEAAAWLEALFIVMLSELMLLDEFEQLDFLALHMFLVALSVLLLVLIVLRWRRLAPPVE